jgi:hypothetical protein
MGKIQNVCVLKQVVHIVTTVFQSGDCNGVRGILNYYHKERDAKTLAHTFSYMIGLYNFFYLVCEAIGTAATPGLLCQPWVIMKMIVEKQMECTLAGETEVLRENLPQCHFCPSQSPT